jgi:hypothetical protein
MKIPINSTSAPTNVKLAKKVDEEEEKGPTTMINHS